MLPVTPPTNTRLAVPPGPGNRAAYLETTTQGPLRADSRDRLLAVQRRQRRGRMIPNGDEYGARWPPFAQDELGP
jgi:hypothetical protein